MEQPTTIKIDNVEYIRADSVPGERTKKQVVVLQRGWAVVGNVVIEGDEVSISDCSVIRRWGTSKGLGELALKGPLPDTILDKCPPVSVHHLGVVLRMDTTEANW